jgi:hypothetical protein
MKTPGPSVRFTRGFLIFLGTTFAIATYAVSREPETASPYAIPVCAIFSVIFLGTAFFGSESAVKRLGRWLHW